MRNILVGAVLAAVPVLVLQSATAQAASLSVAPVLMSAQAADAGGSSWSSAVAHPASVPSVASPLDLKGYAQWKSPTRTLEMVGYGLAEPRSSYGSALPLKDALQLILPDGWQVYAKTGVSGDFPVTWKAVNQPWTQTLREVLRQSGLIGTVNWPHEALLLRVKPTPATPPLNTKGYTAWNNASSSAGKWNGSGDMAAASAPSLAGSTPVFLLNRGDLILTDLQKWAKQSGWTVVWRVPEDWQVPNTTTFSGDFQKAVSQVIQALSANGANVHAVFHTANNTVVISGAGGGE
jgi:hypothetical protein